MQVATDLQQQAAVGEVPCQQAARCIGKLVSASRAVPIAKLLFRELNDTCAHETTSSQIIGSPRSSEVSGCSATSRSKEVFRKVFAKGLDLHCSSSASRQEDPPDAWWLGFSPDAGLVL